MKTTLEFDSEKVALLALDLSTPDGRREHKRMTSATDAYIVLWDIGQQVFRPARKHGYSHSPRLNELLEGDHGDSVTEAISLLEKKFYEIMEERGVNLDDLE